MSGSSHEFGENPPFEPNKGLPNDGAPLTPYEATVMRLIEQNYNLLEVEEPPNIFTDCNIPLNELETVPVAKLERLKAAILRHRLLSAAATLVGCVIVSTAIGVNVQVDSDAEQRQKITRDLQGAGYPKPDWISFIPGGTSGDEAYDAIVGYTNCDNSKYSTDHVREVLRHRIGDDGSVTSEFVYESSRPASYYASDTCWYTEIPVIQEPETTSLRPDAPPITQ